MTEERQAVIDFTVPYYRFSQQITVRRDNAAPPLSLEGTRRKRVGTLSASLAQSMMIAVGGIVVVPYPSPVEIYKDLELGRTEAVLLDVPIAAWYAGPNPKLKNVGDPIGEGLYAGGVAGLIAAVFLARAAERRPGLHLILVLLAAALMLLLPPLV